MEEVKFPLSFNKCPSCGGKRRVSDEVLKGEIAKGKAGEDIHSFLFQYQSAINDPRRTVLSVPVIISFFDVCVDCGTVYCINAQVASGVLGEKPKMPEIGGGVR